jgi:Rrf2 family iron-sulfur cluster assembly transcriptional regulator
MIRFGRTAQTAIAATSLLAEVYDGGHTRLSSHEIAERRGLPQPVVAKVLTTLSALGVVDGSRGPGGGYWLARSPDRISLYEIVAEFERLEDRVMCPFGPDWCGQGDPCPMHDTLVRFDQDWETYLRQTHLDVFAGTAAKPRTARAAGGRRARG